MPKTPITFRPIKLETIVVMRGERVIGTIRRYRQWKGCLVHVEGLLDSSAPKGSRFFRYVREAKVAILAADADAEGERLAA